MTRILIVDDDADQRETLHRGLFLLGHDCLTARSPVEALALLDGVELLLLDLTRAGKPGAALIAARPTLPALVIAGLVITDEVRALGVPTLQKPFTADQLGLAIDALMKPPRRV